MKVIHFCRTFSKLSETFIYDVITELESTEFSNQVVTWKRINAKDRPFEKVTILQPSFIYRILNVVKKLLAAMRLNHYDQRKQLADISRKLLLTCLKKERPDLIHAHFGLQGWAIMPVALKLNIPFVVSFHGYDAFRLPEAPEWRSRFKELFAAAAAITVVSVFMREHLINLGCPESKLHLIRVGKRVSEYHYRELINKPIRNFISIGRLCEKKGFIDCISAFKLLLKKYPDLTLKIVGAGELEAEIRELLEDEALKNSITLLGALPHDKVKAHLAQSDAFILCSKTSINGDKEGVPTVLMEAQAMGLPCVSTLHSGISEVIPPSALRFLAKEGDPGDIALKIEALIDTPKEALENLRLDGRKLIESKFNLKKENYKLSRLYHSLIR